MRYTARVIPGRGEGKKLGIPTINLDIPVGFDLQPGIYAGAAWIDGVKHPAAIHYGPVPVFGIPTPSLEVHVIDVDIPVAPVELAFETSKFLREIKSFPNLEALAEQIQTDIRQAREM